ncbi:hypothetical protein D623_10017128 [Myotis brandtii]|uniref:Uncharacterized protein n=1 Tax=Myotis brandtii TaxID=109478 RepID=S7PHR2_MYOBR|nr:hypothetical protein D623_10017128 [Myotis brandtii]
MCASGRALQALGELDSKAQNLRDPSRVAPSACAEAPACVSSIISFPASVPQANLTTYLQMTLRPRLS